MKRRFVLTALAAVPLAAMMPDLMAKVLPEVQVFKSPYCGCCRAWVDHLRSAGFAVKVSDVEDTTAARKRLGMPDRFGSCHTATADGYVLEGHVPAAEVRRLLASRPQAMGLAVPGMPPGSPGMEVGSRQDPYQVLLIDRSGQARVFANYPK